MSRLEENLDAGLHLLDRQIADAEGALVGKVDDLELTEYDDGRLEVTGLLLGPAALVPRLVLRHADQGATWWHRTGLQWRDHDRPGWIALDDVARLDSEVTLRRTLEDVVVPQPGPAEGTHHRRGAELLESEVIGPEGPFGLHVRDLRLAAGPRPVVRALVVSRGRPGTLLGYDRDRVRRPVLLAVALRALNRHTGELAIGDVEIDWAAREVHARTRPGPLTELDD